MTPEELWQTLLDETGDALIEEAAAVSPARAEAELAAAGVDVTEVYGQADAFLASLRTGAPTEAEDPAAEDPAGSVRGVAIAVDQTPPPRSAMAERKKPRAIPMWVAAAAATVTAGAAVAYVATRPTEGPPPSPTTPPSTAAPPPSADLVTQARDLRRRAAAACNAGRAQECLALLDDASDKDPAGDTQADVKALRKKADDELSGGNGKPKP